MYITIVKSINVYLYAINTLLNRIKCELKAKNFVGVQNRKRNKFIFKTAKEEKK